MRSVLSTGHEATAIEVIHLAVRDSMCWTKGEYFKNMNHARSKVDTAYYGAEGGIVAPLFSCGSMPLAPSFLTGNGSHMVLWTSVVIHVMALVFNIAANVLFFAKSGDTAADLLWTWSISSLAMHTIGVLGTVVSTALVKDSFVMPLVNTLGVGLFLGGILATAKISYTHGLSQPAQTGENIFFNLSLFAQSFGIASLVSNALCALSIRSNGGI